MRSLPFAGAALVLFSVHAFGADAPNLVGSWTRTTHTMSLLKDGAKPLFTHAEDQTWKMKIDSQDSSAFSGELSGPVGKPQPVAGAFQADGKHFVFSTENESGSGEASSDELQYCWTSSRPIIAGCATFKRDK
jgi:type II secretory pathway pseudopilin PulG